MSTKEKQQHILKYKNKLNTISKELHESTLTPHQLRHKYLESVHYKNKLKELNI